MIFNYLVIVALGLLSVSCALESESLPSVSANSQPAVSTTSEDSAPYVDLSKYRYVPEQFVSFDFRNHKFPFGQLKNGDLDERRAPFGGTSHHLDDVLFVDVTGDKREEAVVSINSVSCGGSCDGGATTLYFYASGDEK